MIPFTLIALFLLTWITQAKKVLVEFIQSSHTLLCGNCCLVVLASMSTRGTGVGDYEKGWACPLFNAIS